MGPLFPDQNVSCILYNVYSSSSSSSSSSSAALDHWIKTVVVPEEQTKKTFVRIVRMRIEIHLETGIPMMAWEVTSARRTHTKLRYELALCYKNRNALQL